MGVLALALTAGCGGRAESGPAGGGSGGTAGTSAGGTSTGGTAGTSSGGTSTGGSGGVPVDSGTPDVKPPPEQQILFEVTYENYAWQPSLNGVFITSDGSIYSYDFFAGDAGATPPAVIYPATEQEVRARYGQNPKKTGSIPLSELYAHFTQVSAAASGVLLRQYLCADAGESTSIGYLYDEATAHYTRVILGMDGDQAGLNTAPEAASLVKWLSKYAKLGGSCSFMAQECTGATCGTPAPSCPNNQVPSVVNGCWGKCVSPDHCLSVSDCGVCPNGMVCAAGKDGVKHCLMSTCQSTDACSCPFTPPCAGGGNFCTNTGSLRVRCGT